MKADDIEKYLAQLGQALADHGVEKPVRVLMIGGAYMLLLANMPRSTDDVDIFWLGLQGDERDSIPLIVRQAAYTVASTNNLDVDWFNDLTDLLLHDLVHIPAGKLWRKYGQLHIYIPAKEYILALKILAGREKDIEDCKALLRQTKIKTRQQASRLMDRYILPFTQEHNISDIEKMLDVLFKL
jgi:predicted nucleotidyltransferase